MGQNTADDQERGDVYYYLFASDPKYRFDDSLGIPPDLGGVICRAEDKATADLLVELHAERYANSGLGLVARPASDFSSRAYIDLAAHLWRLEEIVSNLGSEYHPCDDRIEAMAICAKRLSELEELIAAGGKLAASDKSVADQGTPENEYFLSLVLRAPDTDPREVITFYSLRDSNDARLASRLTRLFTMKYKSNNPDTLPWEQPEFDYRTAAGLDSDTVFMKRDDIARFSEPNTSYSKNAENYFRKLISYTSATDRYAIGSFCHQQAAVWEKMLRDEAAPSQSQDPRKADDSGPPGKVLPNGASTTTPGPAAPLPARPEARFRPEVTSKQDSATDDGMEAQQAEYFLWLTFLDPFEEICFYSLKDSNDARLVSRLCKLFTMKFWDCDPNMPEYKQPHFDYKAVHELDPDSVFLIREDINRFRKHGAWDLDVNLPHDEESLGSFCFQQAAVWEKALRAEAERPRGETSPEKGDHDAQEAENYYLRLCIHKEDCDGTILNLLSFDGVEEEVTYFYRLQDKEVGERLARLFNKRFEDRNEAIRDAYCILHTFSCQAASELDEDERFFLDEEIDKVAAEVSGYEAQWQCDCLELGEPPWVYDPYDPPLYDQENPLSAGCLHHQACKWEEALKPKKEPTNEEVLATLFPEAETSDKGVSSESRGSGTEQAPEERQGAKARAKRDFDARGLVGDEKQWVHSDVLTLTLDQTRAVLESWDREVAALAKGGIPVFEAEDPKFLEWLHAGRPEHGSQPPTISESLMRQAYLIATALKVDPDPMWEYTMAVVDRDPVVRDKKLRDAARRTFDAVGAQVELACQRFRLAGKDSRAITLAEAAGMAQPSSRSDDQPSGLGKSRMARGEARFVVQSIKRVQEHLNEAADPSQAGLTENAIAYAEAAVLDYLVQQFGEQDDAAGNWPRDWHECPEAYELWESKIAEFHAQQAAQYLDAADLAAEELVERETGHAGEKQRNGGIVVFRTPAGTKWKDVTIRFLDGHRVSVNVKGTSGVFNYAQMGMASGKNANPTVQWQLLEKFAEGHGTLDWTDRSADRKNQKRRERLAKDLQAFFGIKGDPISPAGNGWQTLFAISYDE